MRGMLLRSVSMLVVLLMVSGAQAAPVTWTVNNAIFDDGATLIGQFDYDDITGLYSNIALSSSSGSFFPAPANYGQAGLWNAAEVYFTEFGSSGRVLGLQFEQALTSAGGILELGAFESITPPDARWVLAGATVTAVPIPAAAWLFGSALAGLGYLRKRIAVQA
jgi:hypothetical protein